MAMLDKQLGCRSAITYGDQEARPVIDRSVAASASGKAWPDASGLPGRRRRVSDFGEFGVESCRLGAFLEVQGFAVQGFRVAGFRMSLVLARGSGFTVPWAPHETPVTSKGWVEGILRVGADVAPVSTCKPKPVLVLRLRKPVSKTSQ